PIIMLVHVKAKVQLFTEDFLEIQAQDLDIKPRDVEWGWRDITIPEEEIYKLQAYTKTKTLLIMYDREMILVAEPHEEVSRKWEEAKKSSKEPFREPEEEEINEENENSEG